MNPTVIRRLSALAGVLALVAATAACGPGGPASAGSITLPRPTAITQPDSTPPGSVPPPDSTLAPDTTVPGQPTLPGETTATTVDGVDPGGPTDEPGDPEEPDASSSSVLTVYFIDGDGSAVPTNRTVTTDEVARAAMEAIIGGPTSSEADAGLATALPADTLVLGLRVFGGTAFLDLSREAEAGGGSAAMLGRLAQIVYTLTEFQSVDRVQILLDGEEAEYFSGEGILIADPLTRSDLLSSVPLGDPVGSGTVSVWGPDNLPPVDLDDGSTRRVVLVAADDTLNVRATPGIGGTIIGELEPGVAVALAGEQGQVGSSTWVTVATPAGPGWVNEFYLNATHALDPDDPAAVVSSLADRFASGGDFGAYVSERGLWISHHASPLRFRAEELAGLLGSDTTYRWGSNALEDDSPELRARTFDEAIADRFVSDYFDDDTTIVRGETIEGPNGRPAEFAIPIELAGFDYLTVFDPGDEPEYEGLDWTGWIVSLALEDGEYKVIALTIDEWAP